MENLLFLGVPILKHIRVMVPVLECSKDLLQHFFFIFKEYNKRWNEQNWIFCFNPPQYRCLHAQNEITSQSD